MAVDLPTFCCKRCGHKWVPRNPVIPKVCPKCKSPYWGTDKKLDSSVQSNQEEKKP